MSRQANYDLKSVQLPRLSGRVLHLFAKLMETPATRALLLPRLMNDTGISAFRQLKIDEPPMLYPHAPIEGRTATAEANSTIDLQTLSQPPSPGQKGFSFATVQDFARAYRAGQTTPEAVAQKVLDAIADSDKGDAPLRAFIACNPEDILAQAQASTQRLRAGEALSIFDGVPVAVKDEVDQVPYGTTVGTRFLGKTPAEADSTVVARMRAAGALLIGKTNMHEIGLGVTGLNPHHGVVRNPYNLKHHTGGSSSGSAAAVAAGLCPVAIGADGGGSIRIPAGFCGLVGLKPTFGRISEFGAAPLNWSVAHLGPIAATASDAALAYTILAGPDPKDPASQNQPPITLAGLDQMDLSDLTLGIYRPWFEHATPAMVSGCEAMLKALTEFGAQVKEITIPELEPLRAAHIITIISEMAAGLERYYADYYQDFGLDVRVNLSLARTLTARDYLQAQRVRTRAIAHFNQALADVDVIITPATGLTAPPIPGTTLPEGISDNTLTLEIMRFAPFANFTGLPAIVFPAGYDPQGLPIGMQAIGRPWAEHTLLRLARAAEQVIERREPQVYYRLLPDKQ